MYTNNYAVSIDESQLIQKFKISVAPEVAPDSKVFKALFSSKKQTEVDKFMSEIFG